MNRLVLLVALGGALAAAAAPHLLVPADWAPGEKQRVREDLQLDLRQLRNDAPSAITGVVLSSVGGVIAAGGGVLIGLGVAWSQGVGGYGVIGLVIAALPGLVLLIVGVVNLVTKAARRPPTS